MIDGDARGSVDSLLVRLRPFVERRLRSPADVEDVLQDVFLRLHRGLSQLRDDERFGPWIYRIARNAIIDRQRAHSRTSELSDEEAAGADDDRDAKESLSACVAPFVARLPSLSGSGHARRSRGVPHKDAAVMLGISLPGVKSRVQRGRAKLRAMFEECCRLELDARNRVVGYECRSDKDPNQRGGCGKMGRR